MPHHHTGLLECKHRDALTSDSIVIGTLSVSSDLSCLDMSGRLDSSALERWEFSQDGGACSASSVI